MRPLLVVGVLGLDHFADCVFGSLGSIPFA